MESRRDFLKKAAVAAAGLTIVPSKTIAGLGHKAPSDTMNIVGIGIGGIMLFIMLFSNLNLTIGSV